MTREHGVANRVLTQTTICYVHIVFHSRDTVICESANSLKCILTSSAADGSGLAETDMAISSATCHPSDPNKQAVIYIYTSVKATVDDTLRNGINK